MHLKLFMMWKNIFGFFLNMFQGVNTIIWFMKIVQRIRTWKVATFNYRFWDIRNLILLLYKTLSTREEYAHLQGQKLPFISMIMCLIPFQSILFIAQYMGGGGPSVYCKTQCFFIYPAPIYLVDFNRNYMLLFFYLSLSLIFLSFKSLFFIRTNSNALSK